MPIFCATRCGLERSKTLSYTYSDFRLPSPVNAPLAIEVMPFSSKSLRHAQKCQSGKSRRRRKSVILTGLSDFRVPRIHLKGSIGCRYRASPCDVLKYNFLEYHKFRPFIPFPFEGWVHTHGNRSDQTPPTVRKTVWALRCSSNAQGKS
jgi:hypothetical protein